MGHEVQVFESAAEFVEVGAGVQLGPNVTRVLHGLGLSRAMANVAAFPEQLQARDASSGRVLGTLRLGDVAVEHYGFAYATAHRADLHGVLLQALSAGSETPNLVQPSLILNQRVEEFQQNDAGVILRVTAKPPAHQPHLQELHTRVQDIDSVERTVQGDLLIGADGLWSRVRTTLLNDGLPQPTGHLAYRALICQASLPKALRSTQITAWLGPRLHVVQYPVRGGDWLNVACFVHGLAPANSMDWDARGNAEMLRIALGETCTSLQNLIQATQDWRLWVMHRRAPMRGAHQHAKGRVALLGDAAHPMLPFLAQGAGMAIEDAAVLGQCLSLEKNVPLALQHYANRRWARNARVQARSTRNGQIFHATGPLRWGRDLSMKMLGERVMDLPWLYGAAVT